MAKTSCCASGSTAMCTLRRKPRCGGTKASTAWPEPTTWLQVVNCPSVCPLLCPFAPVKALQTQDRNPTRTNAVCSMMLQARIRRCCSHCVEEEIPGCCNLLTVLQPSCITPFISLSHGEQSAVLNAFSCMHSCRARQCLSCKTCVM